MRKLSLSTGTGMSRPSKAAPQMKKVMPPAVPEIYGKERNLNGGCLGPDRDSDRDAANEILPAGAGVDLTVIDGGNGAALAVRTVLQQSGAGTSSLPNSVGGGHGHGHGGRSAISISGTNDGSITTPTPAGAAVAAASATPSSLVLRCTSDASGVLDYALDDQGIDLTQSPGRDSPVSLSGSAGSGSRHSTASLDSGRASSYLTGASNLSNRSVSGVGSYGVLSSPRCSVSSCSIGSGSGGGGGSGSGSSNSASGSHRLSNHSNRCDHDIISEWLMEVHFHEYTYLFLDAGYDLATIARMTPEDLTAIGIRKPNHRERLKRHIDALKLPDSLPSFVPGSIEEWLRLLRLEEYVQPLLAQGYQTVHDVTQLTWEDLEDIGIVKLGHQKKILLAIKRVKDIISGKMMQQQQQLPYYGSPALLASTGSSGGSPTSTIASRAPPLLPGTVGVRCVHYTDDTGIGLRSDSALGIPSHQQHQQNIPSASATAAGVACGNYSTFLRQHQHQQQPIVRCPGPDDDGSEVVYYAHQPQHLARMPQSNLAVNAPRQQQLQQMITYPHVHFDGTQAVYRRSSFDDSDITPTNDDLSHAILPHHQHPHQHLHHDQQQQQQQQNWLHSQHQQQQQYFQGGGTLPRQYQRGSYGTRLAFLGSSATAGLSGGPVAQQGRQRPIAKIVANNLKLPGTVAPPDTVVAESAASSPSALCFPAVAAGLPASLLGHIENVEMATAALDAMHFSNYSSAAAAYTTTAQPPQQQQQHASLLKYGMKAGIGSSQEPNAAISQLISSSGGEASQHQQQQQQQQQQPIYHNQLILQQSSGHGVNNYHHLGPQQQQQQHSYTSSTQSTPSPPNQHHHLLGAGVPFAGFTNCHTHQTTVEVHKVSTQQHDNKSNSSLESIDQIPFANENAGTIKQRSSLNRPSDYHHHHQVGQTPPQPPPHHHHTALLATQSSSSASSSSSSASTGSITTTAATTCTGGGVVVLQKQQQSSPSPAPETNDSCGSTATVAAGNTTGGSAKDEHRQSEVGASQELTTTSGGDIYGTNVLNDIGHMLANLTDELDAMLEDEKCAGISDAD
uniref:SAM domain-containing protein n=1 Tax=Anopheles marajoara TaxID=58244 RepID=A0A2M4BBC4_9DIPT